MMSTSEEFFGRGWRFWSWPNRERKPSGWLERGAVAMAEYEESIQQSVAIILGTARGERVMRPEFGCGLHELVFANNSPSTSERAVREVHEALLRWEPRIEVLHVYAEFYDQPNQLLIEVEYRVRSTNNRFNLVYPFYLE
jgi:phage baseplate assembly protein W